MLAGFVLASAARASQPAGDYAILARFDNVGTLEVGAPVRVAGVVVGRVSVIALDAATFEAVVTLAIERRYDRLPVDTTASIHSTGLMGEHYVALDPGAEERYLTDQGEIRLTQSALILEEVIGQFLFGASRDAP